MERTNLKIGELSFDLIVPDDSEVMPSLEVENNDRVVLENIDVVEAIKLRNLLDKFIHYAADS